MATMSEDYDDMSIDDVISASELYRDGPGR
ncbi:hypothetical protein QFZ67_004990 [Streptomyces sp. V1I1]|nr:hypothetical protein [Streptomyces sp. V1I1]